MIFDSNEDGKRFYNAYAKVKGFSVQKDNIHKDNVLSLQESEFVQKKDIEKLHIWKEKIGKKSQWH
ncbi:hypothetical protein RHMOL_Rhmol03G0149100 [Rhododendron molle]|uniref:Uncharacterized protein n=1 Tax=Rhododendron molle TaxID=49168 RepID=A0ACC0PEH2_RHOML|nr:hypothetical protein RHMOL_Rhmol03G0149100 [Rhododendron molle]